MSADRWIDVLAAGTGFAGALLAWVLWRRVRRSTARDRRRHPATAIPVELTIAETSGGPRWQACIAPGWPSTSLEILTFRTRDAEGDWISEPIVEPVALDPVRPVVLDTILPDGEATYEVVLAWTTHGLQGSVPGSLTITVPEDPRVGASTGSSSPFRWAYPIVGLLLAGTGLVGTFGALDAESGSGTTAPGASAAPTTPDASVAPSTPSSGAPVDQAPETSTPTAPPSSAPADSTAPPTASTTETTAATSTTPTTAATGPRIELDGRVEDCRFGAECVIVGFRIVEFEGSGEYVCEFDDGSRFVFRYGGDGADDACARSGPNPSVVVEVDGIRSLTATRTDPNGR